MGDIDVNISEKQQKTIKDIFSSMMLNEAEGGFLEKESITPALDWLKENPNIGTFINGEYVKSGVGKVVLPGYDQITSLEVFLSKEMHLISALEAANQVHSQWADDSSKRMDCLNKIGQNIEKNKHLFSLLECLSTMETIDDVQRITTPIIIQSFYHYAGHAVQLVTKAFKPIGIAYIVSNRYVYPFTSMYRHIAAALAAGNAVVLHVDPGKCFSAFYLAQIIKMSGLPDGIFNVLTTYKSLVFDGDFKRDFLRITKIFSPEYLSEFCQNRGIKFDFYCDGNRPMAIVLNGADLHSAVHGVLRLFCKNYPRYGCNVLVQDNIKDAFTQLLLIKFRQLRYGSPLCNVDLPFCTNRSKTYDLEELPLAGASVENLKIANKDLFLASLVYNVVDTYLLDNVKLPLLIVSSFRTSKEAIAICNHQKSGCNVSLWCENLTTSLQVAHSLKSPNIWINGQNVFDVSACYGRAYNSGSLREGGTLGFFQYVEPQKLHFSQDDEASGDKVDFTKDYLNETFLLYSGGTFKQAEGGTWRDIYASNKQKIAAVPDGSRKDIRNAVESAVGALSKWESMTSFVRTKIFYSLAKNFKAAQKEFCDILSNVNSAKMCDYEVTSVYKRLLAWAGSCGKNDGSLRDTQMYGKVLETQEPLGVMGIVCPDESPLLSFVSLVIPAIVFGNTVTVVPSERYPLPALRMCKLFHSSGIPGGVINVVTGCPITLTKQLVQHMEVESLWIPKDNEAYRQVVIDSPASNCKRFWLNETSDWNNQNEATDKQFLLNSIYTKTIWIPMKDIFAN